MGWRQITMRMRMPDVYSQYDIHFGQIYYEFTSPFTAVFLFPLEFFSLFLCSFCFVVCPMSIFSLHINLVYDFCGTYIRVCVLDWVCDFVYYSKSECVLIAVNVNFIKSLFFFLLITIECFTITSRNWYQCRWIHFGKQSYHIQLSISISYGCRSRMCLHRIPM